MSEYKLDLRLSEEARKALNTLAENDPIKGKKQTFAADHVREALRVYFEQKGIQVSTDVKRGGNRRTA